MERNSKINWFLVIVGLLVLSSFIILPPLFRLIDNYNNDLDGDNRVPQIKNSWVCTLKLQYSDYEVLDQVTIYNDNDLINVLARNVNKKYKNAIDIDMTEYENKKNNYGIVKGFYYNYAASVLELKEEYRFTVSEIEGYDFVDGLMITNSLGIIKNDLITKGYICD